MAFFALLFGFHDTRILITGLIFLLLPTFWLRFVCMNVIR